MYGSATWFMLQIKDALRKQAAYDVDPPLSEGLSYIQNEMGREGYRHLLAVGRLLDLESRVTDFLLSSAIAVPAGGKLGLHTCVVHVGWAVMHTPCCLLPKLWPSPVHTQCVSCVRLGHLPH